MKKTCIKVALLCFILNFTPAEAGFNGVTHHSRANCINNESISWDWTRSWYFWVRSQHVNRYTGAIIHTNATGWVKTWRAAVVHWGEGRGGWLVRGWHWMLGRHGEAILMARESVDNCSIYDGWWDKNKK